MSLIQESFSDMDLSRHAKENGKQDPLRRSFAGSPEQNMPIYAPAVLQLYQ